MLTEGNSATYEDFCKQSDTKKHIYISNIIEIESADNYQSDFVNVEQTNFKYKNFRTIEQVMTVNCENQMEKVR